MTSPCRTLLDTWLKSLPKYLWQLSNKDKNTTEIILQFLLWLNKSRDSRHQKSASLFSDEARLDLQSTLHTYFWVDHPTKGPCPGPWSRLTAESSQKLALDVATAWGKEGDELTRAVGVAVAKAPVSLSAHWSRTEWERRPSRV